MLILPKRKSTFNFFESFSDLVFCTLVMFLVLVLFLAMNVNEQQEFVQLEEDRVAEMSDLIDLREEDLQERMGELEQAEADLEEEIAAIEAEGERRIEEAQEQLAQMQRDLAASSAALQILQDEFDRQSRIYQEALGSNRFAGLPAHPRLVVAYDWQPNRISIHPVPAWLIDQLNASPAGLSDQQLMDYLTLLRGRFLELAQEVPPLTPRQYRALIRSISVGLEPLPQVGEAIAVELDLVYDVNDDGTPTTRVRVAIPGGNGEQAGIRQGDTLISIDGQPVSPTTLPGVLAGYAPGDAAGVLVRRGDREQMIALTFREVRVVELVEAFRTDLSMVASGARDVSYRALWETALLDDLWQRLQRNAARDAVWQGQSRWDTRVWTEGRPVLVFDFDPAEDELLIGGQGFSIAQFRRVLEALGGGGVVVEYVPEVGPEDLPSMVYDQALRPTGFVMRAPQLDQLLQEIGDVPVSP